MKGLFYFLLPIMLLNGSTIAQDIPFSTTEYFEFHSDYWMSLHHFYYQMADGSQLRNLEEDGDTFLDIGEQKIVDELSEVDRVKFNEVITYYENHLIDKSLFRLGYERVWLQEQSPETAITDTTFSKAFTDILNLGSEVYRKNFWSIHDLQSRSVVELHHEMIKELEEVVIERMVTLSGSDWPQGKIRVDVSAYANYAGAYTPTRPKINIFISTLDPSSLSSAFIETVFHEGSHTLFTREGPVRSKIYFRSEEMGMEFPNGLWHAAQFYLVGLVVKDELAKKGFLHTLLMDDGNIFSNFNNPEFRMILDDYYAGDIELEVAVDRLLLNVKE